MDEQQIQPKSQEQPELIIVLDHNNVNCLKDLLLYSLRHINEKVIVKVPLSRYLKILSDYWSMNGIYVEGALENYSKYKFYILSDLDNNGNVFKIVQMKKEAEKGNCSNCNCTKKRYINPTTNNCYYNEMITNNYTTKIK